METRVILESAAVRLAARNANKKQVSVLEKLVRQGRRYLEARDRKGLMRIDHEFHISIAEASGNPVIAELVGSLKQRSNPLWFLTITGEDRLRSVQREHEEIAAAIKAADPEVAERSMNLHIDKLTRIPGEF